MRKQARFAISSKGSSFCLRQENEPYDLVARTCCYPVVLTYCGVLLCAPPQNVRDALFDYNMNFMPPRVVTRTFARSRKEFVLSSEINFGPPHERCAPPRGPGLAAGGHHEGAVAKLKPFRALFLLLLLLPLLLLLFFFCFFSFCFSLIFRL